MRCAVPVLLLMIAPLSACGGGAEDAQVTETRIDDLDSLEGTISDEMADTSSLNEQALIDSSSSDVEESDAKKPAKAQPKPAEKPAVTSTPAPEKDD